MNLTNTKIVLKRRPNPEVSEDLFDIITDTVRELNKEEFLVEVSYVSIDPAMRGWISTVGNYSKPVAFDEPMRSFGVGKIISTKNIKFEVGDFVVGWLGWQKYSIVKPLLDLAASRQVKKRQKPKLLLVIVCR